MDIQKLKPVKSQWGQPLLNAEDARTRAGPPPVASIAKRIQEPPKGKGGPLWQKFYADAVARKHPMPEKLADTLLRSREYALEIEAKRRKVMLTTKAPKAEETVSVNKGANKAKPVVNDALRCKALTLEGRRCGFKATCGDFCKKHAVEKI